MDTLDHIKCYLKQILQQERSQEILEVYPRLRDFHHYIDGYSSVVKLIQELSEIEKDLQRRHRELGFNLNEAHAFANQLLQSLQEAVYLKHEWGLSLISPSKADQESSYPVKVLRDGLTPELVERITHFAVLQKEDESYLVGLNDQDHPIGYFHIHHYYDYPSFYSPTAFKEYLAQQSTGMIILHRIPRVQLSLTSAKQKLDELCRQRWGWSMLKNNSATFVDSILKAGHYSGLDLKPKVKSSVSVPKLNLKALDPHYLDGTQYEEDLASSSLEKAFHQALTKTRILQINVATLQESSGLSLPEKQGALLRYVLHHAAPVLKWQTDLRKKSKELDPEALARADILHFIEKMILETDWKIQIGGVNLQWQVISHTMREILKVIRREDAYVSLSVQQRLNKIQELAKKADQRRCLTRTEQVREFYRNLTRWSTTTPSESVQVPMSS